MSYPPRALLSLIMRRGPQPNQRFLLDRDSITIGRAPGNSIVIPDEEVSRHHARLTRQGNLWILQDLGSSSGTFVNGQRITAPVFLPPGSQIGFGPKVLFTVEDGLPAVNEMPIASAPALVSSAAPTTVTTAAPRRSLTCLWLVVGAAAVVFFLGIAAVFAYVYLNPSVLDSMLSSQQMISTVASRPFVAFQEPTPGDYVDQGDFLFVSATARDSDKVVRMDLWVDGQLVVTQDSPDPAGISPLTLMHPLIALAPGEHPLSVRAYNSRGLMSETPVIYVTVLERDEEEPPQSRTALYVAQPDDITLDALVNKLGVSAADIQQHNPAFPQDIEPGQIIAVPVRATLSRSPESADQSSWFSGVQPDAKPTSTKPGQQSTSPPQPDLAGQAEGDPGWIVIPRGAAVPGALPGLVPVEWLAPGFALPAGMGELAPPSLSIKAPFLKEPTTGDCTVSLEWEDRSNNETQFRVKRLKIPSSISAPIDSMPTVPVNQIQCLDKVPEPGSYRYTIVAETVQGRKTMRAESNPRIVTVVPSATCVEKDHTYKLINFEPLNITPSDPSLERVALRLTVENADTRRIPRLNGLPDPVGAWAVSVGRQRISVPISDPSALWVNFDATGYVYDIDILDWRNRALGYSDQSYPYEDLQDPKHRWTFHSDPVSGVGSRPTFSLLYHLWMEDSKWTGTGTAGRALPAPVLHLAKHESEISSISTAIEGYRGADPSTGRVLYWDFAEAHKLAAETFILSRSYSCPGQDAQITAPRLIETHRRGVYIPADTEPVGCTASYWVSAYGPTGESEPSNTVTVPTAAAAYRIQVAFKTLRIGQDDPAMKETYIRIRANDHKGVSAGMLLSGTTSIDLSQVPFGGKIPGNVIAVNVRENESIIVDISAFMPGAKQWCKIQTLVQPDTDWQSFTQKSLSLRSGDDSGDCQAEIEVSKVQTVQVGEAARGEADIGFTTHFIGKDIYVQLFNQGPDRAVANQLKIVSSWVRPAGGDRKSEQHITSDRIVEIWWPSGRDSVTVKVNSLVIGEDINGQDVELWPQEGEIEFRVEVIPVDFVDPNVDNNVEGGT